MKILEQEGVKVPLGGGFNSLDGISAVLISLKPSGPDVYVFQLSIMQSSCWSILNKPPLHSPLTKKLLVSHRRLVCLVFEAVCLR